jgi:hypothetical protein
MISEGWAGSGRDFEVLNAPESIQAMILSASSPFSLM